MRFPEGGTKPQRFSLLVSAFDADSVELVEKILNLEVFARFAGNVQCIIRSRSPYSTA